MYILSYVYVPERAVHILVVVGVPLPLMVKLRGVPVAFKEGYVG